MKASSSASASTPRSLVRRACDRCHARRVKCDGDESCARCSKSGVRCTYDKPVLKKGPVPRASKGRRSSTVRSSQDSNKSGSTSDEDDRHRARTNSRRKSSFLTVETVPTPPSDVRWLPDPPPILSQAGSSIPTALIIDPTRSSPPPTTSSVLDMIRGGKPAPPHWKLDWPNGPPRIPSPTWKGKGKGKETGPDVMEWLETSGKTQSATGTTRGWNASVAGEDHDDEPFWSQFIDNTSSGLPAALEDTPLNSVQLNEVFRSMLATSATSFVPFVNPLSPHPLHVPRPFYVPAQPDLSRLFTFTLDTQIKPQIEIFFQRIHPMIPIFTRSYIFRRLDDPEALQDRDFIAMILAMTALSLVHPLDEQEMKHRQQRAKQATLLMDEALKVACRWDFGSTATFEAAMTSYFMFGTLFELGHAQAAKLRLNEAIGLGDAMGLDRAGSYDGLDYAEMQRRIRLYWVLSVTERAYALQRTGNIVFEGTISTRLIKTIQSSINRDDLDNEPISQSLRYLAQLFSFVDKDIVACWNGHCDRKACSTLTHERAVAILSRLGGTPASVFGHDFTSQLVLLTESQQADLLITWQWLKNRVWRLASQHGLTMEGAEHELSGQYIVDVTTMTLEMCQGLSMQSMEAHGTGFVEKLYDIANLIPSLMQDPDITDTTANLFARAQAGQLSTVLRQLYSYVARYRQGESGFVLPLAEAVSTIACIENMHIR